ncbi:uncharacterized protein [Parasteatoda tepidariorum]|uniref:uncharacterized protein n=1 Tax=Parasteatoda tepidariorum TaxID=114398 RepID=UPI00077FD137|nr:uncharacterized protein LOC107444959 [Parasteatoda tepidariorum]
MFTKLLIFAASIGVILAADNNDVLNCIQRKYDDDLGNSFTSCYESSQKMRPDRITTCYTEVMQDIGVVVTASNGQMTVDRTKFGEYGNKNSEKPIGKAMEECFNNHKAGDNLYKKAATASQCVFSKVKKICDSEVKKL